MTTSIRPSGSTAVRPWWLWVATALAFPPAGLIGHVLVDRVDSVGAALVGGVVTGAFLGLAQWAVLRRRGASLRWIIATAAGLGVGLAAGAALVDYETSLGALVVMGAVCGAAVGLAQAASFDGLRRHVVSWTAATVVLWPLGWAVSTGIIDADEQFTLFGISGALVVAFLQGVLLNRLVPADASDRELVHHG